MNKKEYTEAMEKATKLVHLMENNKDVFFDENGNWVSPCAKNAERELKTEILGKSEILKEAKKLMDSM